LKFFLQKNFNRLCTKTKPKEHSLQHAYYTNQTKRRITAIPVAFLLFAKMQTPRPSATPLFFYRKTGGQKTPGLRPPPLFFLQKKKGVEKSPITFMIGDFFYFFLLTVVVLLEVCGYLCSIQGRVVEFYL
jgi:hypothetical protein